MNGVDGGLRSMLGTGMASKAEEMTRLRQQYDNLSIEAQVNGQPFPTFQEWLKNQKQSS